MRFYKQYSYNHIDSNGVYPQIVNYSLISRGNIIDRESITINNSAVLPQNLSFRFFLDDNTLLTDVLSFSHSIGKSLIVSSRFKTMMEKFNLGKSNFYNAEVVSKNINSNYFFWLPKELKLEGVNFEESCFINCFYNRKKIKDVNVANEEGYVKSANEMNRGLILAEKLYFKNQKYYTDIIARSWGLEGMFFSPKIVEKILELNYTGIEFKDSNVIEFL